MRIFTIRNQRAGTRKSLSLFIEDFLTVADFANLENPNHMGDDDEENGNDEGNNNDDDDDKDDDDDNDDDGDDKFVERRDPTEWMLSH